MADKNYISYDEINQQCRELAQTVSAYGFNKIIAVTRGGMVPACILAELLNIRQVDSISLVGYEGETKSEKICCLSEPNMQIDEKTLFVDDLYDSGMTYSYLKKQYPQAKVAVLYNKNKQAQLDFPAQIKEKDCWIVFPWELELQK